MFFHQQFSGGISGPFIIPHIYFGELRIKVRQLRDANNAIYQKRLVVAAREFVLSKLWVKRWISENSTPITGEGYELGTRVRCAIKRPEIREDMVDRF